MGIGPIASKLHAYHFFSTGCATISDVPVIHLEVGSSDSTDGLVQPKPCESLR